jgi:hypothetical protein
MGLKVSSSCRSVRYRAQAAIASIAGRNLGSSTPSRSSFSGGATAQLRLGPASPSPFPCAAARLTMGVSPPLISASPYSGFAVNADSLSKVVLSRHEGQVFERFSISAWTFAAMMAAACGFRRSPRKVPTLGALLLLLIVAPLMAQDGSAGNPLNEPQGEAGVIPVGADGQPLNLNFETGTLKDWTATGRAFEGQPIKGETSNRAARSAKAKRASTPGSGGSAAMRSCATSRGARSPPRRSR